MLARIVVRSVSLLQKSGTNKRQLATAAKPPSNTPLGAPDGPTAEDMERFNMSRFASLSFREQMAEFKTVMLRQDLKVLIVGSDTTALTTALAFAKNGIKVDMLDSVLSAIDSTPEMAALIPINAQRIFNEMQVYDAISKLGQPLASFGLSDQTGKMYGSINYQELATVHGFNAVGMPLKTLDSALERFLSADGINIKRNAVVSGFQQKKNKVRVEYEISSSGGQFKEKRDGEYDVVVISDGTFSLPRESAFPQETQITAKAVRYDAIVKRPNDIPASLMVDMWGNGKRCGFVPVAPRALYLYGMAPLPRGIKMQDMKVKQMHCSVFLDEFKEFTGPWTIASKAVQEKGSCLMSFSVSTEPKRYTNGRIVLAGNAAHGFGPFLTRGQEIGIGVEDAYYLAQHLSLRSIPIDQAIASYEKRSHTRVKPIMANTKREMAAIMQNLSGLRAKARDFVAKFFYRTSALTSTENRLIGVDSRRAARTAFASKIGQQSPEAQKAYNDLQYAPMAQRQFMESQLHRNLSQGKPLDYIDQTKKQK